MDLEEARAFVRQHPWAILLTRRADGRPQLSPVLAAVDAQGCVDISSTEGRAKVENLRRDPRASLSVIRRSFFGGSLQIDGRAEIVDRPEAVELLVDQYRRVTGKEHPDWEEFRRSLEEQGRVLIRVEIERAVAV